MKNKRENIEHPDLTRMTDGLLRKEGEYWYWTGQQLCADISINIFDIQNGFSFSQPISEMIEDLKFSIQRFQAIIEEINYRAEMMR